MLPNHAPLVIAEQFGTLESLYPGRIDLGLGRAPGTDQLTAAGAAPRPRRAPTPSRRMCWSCRPCSGRCSPDQAVQAVPGAGTRVPLWILGSSLFGAQLAAMLGLPYAFASHFAPDALMPALQVYRERFQPSAQLREALRDGRRATSSRPRRTPRRAGCSPRRSSPSPTCFAARAASSRRRSTTSRPTGRRPRSARVGRCSPARSSVRPRRCGAGSRRFIEETGADELIVAAAIYDHAARLRSYEILAEVQKSLGREPALQAR